MAVTRLSDHGSPWGTGHIASLRQNKEIEERMAGCCISVSGICHDFPSFSWVEMKKFWGESSFLRLNLEPSLHLPPF
jgi:hypothetical protein